MSQEKPTLSRGGKPTKAEPTPLSTLDKVRRALASQSRPQSIAEGLTDDEQAAVAATIGPDGFATPATREAVRDAVAAFYERHKAVDGDHDAPADPPAAE